MPEPHPAWTEALRVAALFAADPHGCGGIVVRAGAGPVRERWLAHLRGLLAPGTPVRRMPGGIADDRLIGGLDLAATLRSGRPVAQTGLLAEADGGVIVVPMAERLSAGTVARLAAALDTGAVILERDGLARRLPARFGLVLLDEGREDEAAAEALADRLAFRLDLSELGLAEIGDDPRLSLGSGLSSPLRGGAGGGGGSEGTAALHPAPPPPLTPPRKGEGNHVADVAVDDPAASVDPVATLCAAAEALGVVSLRGPVLAIRVARLAAGGDAIAELHLIEAARLVLAPRATRLPASEPQPEEGGEQTQNEAEPQPPGRDAPAADEQPDEGAAGQTSPEDVVLEAARAAIPKNLLARLLAGGAGLGAKAGRAGAATDAPRTGRPVGSRPGDPRRGRLDLIATLRAAAPWQRLRRGASEVRRVVVRPDDLRIKKLKQRSETTTVFCVDASGSAALERLAEAKGAVEILLAESYVRRDRVALVAFRGTGAEVVLAPTRSLVRAKRALAGLPGGGGTPLAAGIEAAAEVALGVRRGGGHPVVVLLTDGRANVARSGEGGRAQAGAEAVEAGRALRRHGLPVLVIDTGARGDGARAVAEAANGRYCPLPHADAGSLSAAVRAATG